MIRLVRRCLCLNDAPRRHVRQVSRREFVIGIVVQNYKTFERSGSAYQKVHDRQDSRGSNGREVILS